MRPFLLSRSYLEHDQYPDDIKFMNCDYGGKVEMICTCGALFCFNAVVQTCKGRDIEKEQVCVHLRSFGRILVGNLPITSTISKLYIKSKACDMRFPSIPSKSSLPPSPPS